LIVFQALDSKWNSRFLSSTIFPWELVHSGYELPANECIDKD